jgi:tripartite-type tricarboxylate transporter receptor subunit TctC
MNNRLLAKLSLGIAFLFAAVASHSAIAQTYPSRPITLVVPYTPGTGIDIVARMVGPRIAERWGQPVVVDNKPGASGNIGADIVAKAQPHGYTLMVTTITFAMTPGIYKNIPYDPINDFTPIAEAVTGNMALVVNPKVLPVNSLQELIAQAKARPGALNYASPGNGTPQHLGVELFKQQLGLDIVHIPYKGAAGAVTDLINGEVQMAYLPVHTALPFARNNQLRVLGVAGDKRSILAPDSPSFKELGYPNMDLELWYGIFGPAKLPAEIVQKWERELKIILALPDVRDGFVSQGLIPSYGTSLELGAKVKADVARWRDVVEKAKINAD